MISEEAKVDEEAEPEASTMDEAYKQWILLHFRPQHVAIVEVQCDGMEPRPYALAISSTFAVITLTPFEGYEGFDGFDGSDDRSLEFVSRLLDHPPVATLARRDKGTISIGQMSDGLAGGSPAQLLVNILCVLINRVRTEWPEWEVAWNVLDAAKEAGAMPFVPKDEILA